MALYNAVEFGNFANSLSHPKEYKNGNRKAEVIVTVRWGKNKSLTTITKMTLNRTTYEFGIIDIDENDDYNSGFFYTHFDPRYVKYKFDAVKGMLIIKSNEGRFGKYKMEITECL